MEKTPKNRRNIEKVYNFRDKIAAVQYFVDTSLNRTLTMFKYENLPDSLPERELEKILQVNGYGIVTEHEGKIVALWGGWAPPLDVYYRHTKVLVNNPWAKINREFEIDKDCVLVRNDPLNLGLIPILEKYGSFTCETDLTLYLAMINLRTIYNITARDNTEKATGEEFLRKIEEGYQGILMENKFSEGIKTQPYSQGNNGYLTQIIELSQYIKGSFLNEIGLNANYNMKRERLSASETDLNEDMLRPLVDSMLEERQKAVKKINEKYGTNITVEFNSSWSKYNSSEENVDAAEDESSEVPAEENIETSVEEILNNVVEIIEEIKEEENGQTDDKESNSDTDD